MPKKHLGQNFISDYLLLNRIVDAAGLCPDDTVVEIGPGPGGLTKLLADRVKRLIAIELDHELCIKLTSVLSGYKNIELIEGDALKFPYEDIGRFKVAANIPYYITTPIIFRLFEVRGNLESITLTVQKEVAERLVAGPGGKDYGVLSIMVQYYSRPQMKFIVPKEAFWPVPKVDSAVVGITMLDRPAVTPKDEELFFKVVRTAFSQRRKTLSNSLKTLDSNIKEVITGAGIDPRRRPETLSLAEFAKIADLLYERPR
ncbi:MAG: ribosomal RNA small subunit methyltransferase A [Nitrospirae bacterium]|nr:ribosomal RNA small subunit methyltransferase A [Nitrospirota bacterium]